MIRIDGSEGEGGGQILRTSLTLSLLTGQPFCIEGIRARRRKPGLLRQHLIACRAAAEVGQARLEGARIGAGQLTFRPGPVRAGEHRASISTAGSAMLVLQTVLPALALADGPSNLTLEGGTHNPMAPTFDFLAKAYLPLLARMGPRVEARLERHGFYPAGGGRAVFGIAPAPALAPFELVERGPIRARRVTALVAHLPGAIGQREVDTLCDALSWPRELGQVVEVDSAGPGNALMVELESAELSAVFCGFGQRRVPAERVAGDLAREVLRHLAAEVPVDRHLADQLILLMALAGAGRFRTLAPTAHTRTNAAIIGRFLDVDLRIEEIDRDVWEIRVGAV